MEGNETIGFPYYVDFIMFRGDSFLTMKILKFLRLKSEPGASLACIETAEFSTFFSSLKQLPFVRVWSCSMQQCGRSEDRWDGRSKKGEQIPRNFYPKQLFLLTAGSAEQNKTPFFLLLYLHLNIRMMLLQMTLFKKGLSKKEGIAN